MSNSALAPSEKHLEDWIVEYQDDYFVKMCTRRNGDFFHRSVIDKLIGRQVGLPSGRLDLLAVDGDGITVIELKKGKADSECVTQLMRYMGDLRGIYASVYHTIKQSDKSFPLDNYLTGEPAYVRGIMVCQDITDKHLRYTCDAAGIEVLKYTYHPKDDWYSFVSAHQIEDYYDLSNAYSEYTEGFIGRAFSEIMTRWAAQYRRDGE